MDTKTDDKVLKWIAGDSAVATYSNGELSRWARTYLLDQARHKCTECGWGEPNPILGRTILTVDHVDGDWSNNSFTNLKVLCYNCHTLTPTFGRLNKTAKGNRRRSDSRYSPETTISTCAECGVQISVGALRCVKHAQINYTKSWPEIAVLIEKLHNSSFSAVAREIGVSDTGIRKHLKRRGYDPKTLTKVSVDKS